MINIRRLAPTAALAIALAGCATTAPPIITGPGPIIEGPIVGGPVVVGQPQTTAEIVSTIQQYTDLACKFAPTADFVVQLLGANVPGLQTVSSVGRAICASISSKGARRGVRPTVAGIPVQGHRTR